MLPERESGHLPLPAFGRACSTRGPPFDFRRGRSRLDSGAGGPVDSPRAMKLTSLSDVRALLAEWDIRPQKTLGQNFLIDANILDILMAATAVTPADTVLEIGAGLGVFTEALARAAKRVVTVEKDPRLWPLLEARLKDVPTVELVKADMLDLDPDALFPAGLPVTVGNLPYSAGSAILVNLVRAAAPPPRLVVTLQHEVAERLVATPSHKAFGLLTLWCRLRYDVSIRKTVSPTCFFPAPSVGSAILVLTRRAVEDPAPPVRTLFYALTKHAFSRRRKQLRTILAGADVPVPPARPDTGPATVLKLPAGPLAGSFEALGIEPRARPEDLDVAAWLRLAEWGAAQPRA